jgi:hypothetical protein
MHNLSRRTALRGVVLLSAGSAVAMVSRSTAAEEAPLAIKGYDAVAYFTDGKPALGLQSIDYEWDEHRYLFASAEHRDQAAAGSGRRVQQTAKLAVAECKGGDGRIATIDLRCMVRYLHS